jgi:hypothetical protein
VKTTLRMMVVAMGCVMYVCQGLPADQQKLSQNAAKSDRQRAAPNSARKGPPHSLQILPKPHPAQHPRPVAPSRAANRQSSGWRSGSESGGARGAIHAEVPAVEQTRRTRSYTVPHVSLLPAGSFHHSANPPMLGGPKSQSSARAATLNGTHMGRRY